MVSFRRYAMRAIDEISIPISRDLAPRNSDGGQAIPVLLCLFFFFSPRRRK